MWVTNYSESKVAKQFISICAVAKQQGTSKQTRWGVQARQLLRFPYNDPEINQSEFACFHGDVADNVE